MIPRVRPLRAPVIQYAALELTAMTLLDARFPVAVQRAALQLSVRVWPPRPLVRELTQAVVWCWSWWRLVPAQEQQVSRVLESVTQQWAVSPSWPRSRQERPHVLAVH